MRILLFVALAIFYVWAVFIWGLFVLRHIPMILIPILSMSYLLDLADRDQGGLASVLFIAMLVLIALAQRGWDALLRRLEAAWQGKKKTAR